MAAYGEDTRAAGDQSRLALFNRIIELAPTATAEDLRQLAGAWEAVTARYAW